MYAVQCTIESKSIRVTKQKKGQLAPGGLGGYEKGYN